MSSLILVVPIFGFTEELPKLVETLLRTKLPEENLYLVDDGSKDSKLDSFLGELERNSKSPNSIFIIKNDVNLGYTANVNYFFRNYLQSDIIVFNSDVIIPDCFMQNIRNSISLDNTTATLSVWASNGSILTVNTSGFDSRDDVNPINERLTRSSKFPTTIPVAVGHVIYYRRSAINLVGDLDEAFGKGYEEEVEFSLKAVALGFRNGLAENVYVFHRGKASFGLSAANLQTINHRMLLSRYPEYPEYLNGFQSEIENAKRRFDYALRDISIGVDCSTLNFPNNGTGTMTMGILRSLSGIPWLRTTAIIDKECPSFIVKTLLKIPRLSIRYTFQSSRENFDVIWRPYQCWEPARIKHLKSMSNCLVLTIQDLIAFDNFTYHPNYLAWQDFRRNFRESVNLADAITFISHYTENRVLEANLMNPLMPNSVILNPNFLISERIELFKDSHGSHESTLEFDNFILMVGVSYSHKNLQYSLSLIENANKSGLDLKLVSIGDSGKHDMKLLKSRYPFYIHLDKVDERTKDLLYQNAEMVIYPSTVEGFGLVPFEATQNRIVTLSSRQGGLDEVLPKDIPTIDNFNLEVDSSTLINLIKNSESRDVFLSQFSESRDWASYIAEYLNLFESLLSKTNNFISVESSSMKNHRFFMLTKIRVINSITNKILPFGSKRRRFIKKIIGV